MELSKISATKQNTGLCIGGWYWYHNPKKDTVPYAYALKIMTVNPQVYLFVKFPITDELKPKFKELKEKCINSTYHMVEVTFENFVFEYHTEQLTENGLETIKYVASATDFHFKED